jgi:copper chaperone NosL
MTAASGHRHLQVVNNPAPQRAWGRRFGVMGLAGAAAALFAASFFQPWWHFWLFAPQYPKGLELTISLTGVGGDAREVNMLNHYIGMGHLEDAAQFERNYAAYGVAGVAFAVVLLLLLAGRRLGWLAAVAGALFPLGFVVDSMVWLYRFGHRLDPRAPLHIKPFTPQMFGEGVIGQFHTFAIPEAGFWMAAAAVALLLGAVLLRQRVCKSCARAGTCGAVCPSAFIGPRAGLAQEK